jgi:hypothetical protein
MVPIQLNCAVGRISPQVEHSVAPDSFLLPPLLLKNAKRMLVRHHVPFDFVSRRGPHWIFKSDAPERVASMLSNVTGFSVIGIGHLGPLRSSAELAERVMEVFSRPPARDETVSLDCVVDGHGLNEAELSAWLGNRIRERWPHAHMRLLDATHRIGVSVQNSEALVFGVNHVAPGGFPVGSRGRAGVFLTGHHREGELVRSLLALGHPVVGFVDAPKPSGEWLSPWVDYHLSQPLDVHSLSEYARLAASLESPGLNVALDSWDASALIRLRDCVESVRAPLVFPFLKSRRGS